MPFKERIAYLNNMSWREKPLLPFNRKYDLPKEPADTEVIYDFESQENIYSVSAFYVQLHQMVIWYHASDPKMVDEAAVLTRAHKVNDLTLKTYYQELKADYPGQIQITIKPLTLMDLQMIFIHPKRYVVGYNSNEYDVSLASYILAYSYNHDGKLPDPAKVRTFSDLLISPQKTFKKRSDMFTSAAINDLQITIKKRVSLWDLSKFYDDVPQGHNQTCPFQNEAPKIAEVNKRLMNTGLQLDMRTLNEKAKYSSLKRISAQFGYQIEEPADVDLSSDKPLTASQMITLLAYNVSDVLVTMLIYQDPSYQDPLAIREDLLNSFDKTNFKGRLSVNATSAKLVEFIIAPNDPLKDQTEINFFYPTHRKIDQQYQAKISADYDNHNVPLDPDYEQHFLYWLEQTHSELFTKTIKAYQTQLKIYQTSFPQYQVFNSPDYQQYEAGKKSALAQVKVQLKSIRQQVKYDYAINAAYCDFLNNETAKKQIPISEQYHSWPKTADRDSLDAKWTAAIRQVAGFKPVLGPDQKYHEFARVKYGEIELDILEFMRVNFKKFPKEVYELYSYLRGTESEYARDGNGKIKTDFQGHPVVLKTAREISTANYVAHYLPILGRDEHGKPRSPRNVYYKYPKSSKVPSGIGIDIRVPGQPTVLSYSVGGVHGKIMNDQAYLRDDDIINRYNQSLKAIIELYPEASDFYENAVNHTLADSLSDYLNLENFNKTNVKLFVTKTSKNVRYKAFKKEINPKDYAIPIDMHDAVHVDVDSLYPSLMINLHMFSSWTTAYNDPAKFLDTNKTGHWYDVYAMRRLERVKMKKFALATPKEKWTYVQEHAWSIQLKNKLILNSASGIADGKWATNVRMNNKATSMRIIGQLALTYLVFRVEPKGVYSTSTNTDGVYLTSDDPNFNEKQIDAEIEEWKEIFHLGATPEIMSHFVSKDSNNRFEQGSPKEAGSAAGETVGNFKGPNSSSKMVQPFVIDAGIIHYFKTHENICKTHDIPMNDLLDYLKEQQDIILNATEYTPDVRKAMLGFCWPMQPKKGQMCCLANKPEKATSFLPMQHVNRLLLVKHGYYLRGFTLVEPDKTTTYDENLTNWCVQRNMLNDSTKIAKRGKITNFKDDWQVIRVNLDLRAYFKSPVWANLDLKTYADLTASKILGTDDNKKIWVEPEFKPVSISQNVLELTKTPQ